MSLWVTIAAVLTVSVAALVVVARRSRDEIGPTIEAFARFRAALRPAVVQLARDTDDARQSIDRARSGIVGGRR